MKDVKNTTLDDFLKADNGPVERESDHRENKRILFDTGPKTLKRQFAQRLFAEECRRFPSIDRKGPRLLIYEYSTIKYTIREKRGVPEFKICDIYLLASETEFRAIIRKMLRHYSNRKNPKWDEALYKGFTRRPDVEERWKEIRLIRGTGKSMLPPKGEAHDLMELADKIAKDYFQGLFPLPRLGWSKIRAKRRFGHYDRDHNTVMVSKILDSMKVPAFLVEYILYHEFLHIKHGEKIKKNRSYVHTPAFMKDEKKFHKYSQARELLHGIVNGKVDID